ncbi:MAG: roadblock/LC7 domain-containing protein [Myxococcota bacterium]|nr:roadblock/LC7 domain-containing protein [Myxococcota bacterium]
MNAPFVLFDEELQKLSDICEALRTSASAKAIFVVDKNGQLLMSNGETHDLDSTSLASLTAGNMAATDGLAQVLGESAGFGVQLHEGEREHIHISSVGDRLILVVIFDERSSLGLVRLRVKQATEQIRHLMESLPEDTANSQASLFDEISDEDIDQIFGKE